MTVTWLAFICHYASTSSATSGASWIFSANLLPNPWVPCAFMYPLPVLLTKSGKIGLNQPLDGVHFFKSNLSSNPKPIGRCQVTTMSFAIKTNLSRYHEYPTVPRAHSCPTVQDAAADIQDIDIDPGRPNLWQALQASVRIKAIIQLKKCSPLQPQVQQPFFKNTQMFFLLSETCWAV